jgi:outer membrane protein
MIGRFNRSMLAVGLSIATALAPAAPTFAQQMGQSSQQGQGQSAAAAQPQTPGPVRTLRLSDQDYSRGKPLFPPILQPYKPTPVPEPNLTNSPRVEQMIQDGKLRLTLQDAIDLALENNLDIAIQRYTPWLSEANILRQSAGSGVVSRGGTAALGSFPSVSFDPQIISTMSMDQREIPVNNPLTAGTGNAGGATTFSNLSTHTTIGNFQYVQGFHTGSAFSAAFNNTRLSTSSPANFFSPSVTSTFIFGFNQQLLNGFGLLPNERGIRIAKLNKAQSDLTFEQQVITSVTAVANAYWELVFARGNVDVAQHQVELADKLYSDNKKQVDIGTLAPLEIVQAEAQVATANQALIIDRTALLQNQLTLLNLITKDPTAPALRTVEIIPTDTADAAPPEVEKIQLEDAIQEAITKRPDVLTLGDNLKIDDIQMRATRNALLPVLNLSGTYTAQGLAGNSRITPTPTNPNPIQIMSGLGSSLQDMFVGAFPEYNAQVSLTIPIRNRQAQADNVTALLTARQDETRYRQGVNNVAIDVHNAQIVLEQDRATVAASGKTRDLDQQTLDAEQKKYQLGASTLFNIVQDQNILAGAASAEVRAKVNLAEAKVNFDRAMGRSLEVYNITIADAKSGNVPKDTLIPGTSDTGQLVTDRNRQPSPSLADPRRNSATGNGQ